MSKPLVVVRTGDPVPSVLASRGPFSAMIQGRLQGVWRGTYDEFDAREGTFPAPSAAAAFVITGSSANVPNRDAWMLTTEAWLRDVVKEGTPTFGICFGHQILAQALGGEVVKNPRGREIGTVTVRRTVDDPIFHGLPDHFRANATHIDTVARLPPDARALASNDAEDHHAIRFSRACYGVQFHPEIDAHVMRGYVETRRAILEGEGIDVDAMLAEIEEADHGAETLRNFVKNVVL
jgi:GMP synthase (glutamine-hydrolysing)